ncbi:DSD1 family PLP-dependent enzyme [Rhodoplanes sp.]|uniref:DSD1 family PLP-dependent enzyme n=1 Tax=Rhodoplanes sp. TaxID=1968906 RepID=UPI0025D1DDA4|nr:DSD1 family PLP-dependent enzyme [Rhodoplanes sp.]
MTPTMTLDGIETPAALIDRTLMMRNIGTMQSRITALGTRLRPHIKTSKCIEVGRLQQQAGGRGITVSTLKEAEEYFAAGFDDILYAVGIAPQKLDRVLRLRRAGCRLVILVDSLAGADAVIDKGRAETHAFEVMIEVDTDGHRSGVAPDDDLLIEIGTKLDRGGAILTGVLTHAGSSYGLSTPEALQQMAEQERSRCVRAASRLRAAGLPCLEVSIGSTPTALSAQTLDGVTEVRAGVYVFFDLVMANVGVCRPQDIALSVLATVIGHQTDKGWAIVDAGWMAMSRDRGTQAQAVDYGYGAVCDLAGALVDGYVMSGANQEHGIVARRDGVPDREIAQRFPIGARLRILPNHACATATQFDAYQVVDGDGATRIWSRFHGW